MKLVLSFTCMDMIANLVFYSIIYLFGFPRGENFFWFYE